MEKRVLLVFPDISERLWHKGYFHYGLAHISSYLKSKIKDIEVSLLPVCNKNYMQSDFNDKLKEFSPQIIGFTSTSHSFPLVKKLAKWVKDFDSNILTVCGGIHVTINPEDALMCPEIDVIVRGDGEYAMASLVEKWIGQGIIADGKGIWYRKNNGIINNGIAMVENLDLLPDPDWDLFDCKNLDNGLQGIGGLMLSRGCPYQCSYCCNHKLTEIYKETKTGYIRFKSVEKAISEIKNFIAKFPEVHTLYFDDDILPLKKQWFADFADRYKKEINKPYWCNIRPNLIDEEIVDKFVSSGCVRVGIGIESGNEKIRNEVLKRNISDKTIINAVSFLKKKNIYVYSFNMVGVPGETKNALLDTIRFNAKLGIDKMQSTVFYPYKHTVLYDIVLREKLFVSEKSLIEYTQESILKLSFTQKNRVYFTVITLNIIAKAYKKLPVSVAEFILRVLYSVPSSVTFFPMANMIIQSILLSEKATNRARKVYRWIIPPPPTALNVKRIQA